MMGKGSLGMEGLKWSKDKSVLVDLSSRRERVPSQCESDRKKQAVMALWKCFV